MKIVTPITPVRPRIDADSCGKNAFAQKEHQKMQRQKLESAEQSLVGAMLLSF